MKNSEEHNNGNNTCEWYDRVREIYKAVEENGNLIKASIVEVKAFAIKFSAAGEQGGEVFCQKALAVMYKAKAGEENELEQRRKSLEEAHDHINQGVLLAEKINWKQPSLGKWQGSIKVQLADVLHRLNEHHDGNILMRDGLRILGATAREHWTYLPVKIALIEAKDKATHWTLEKMLFDMKGLERQMEHPKNQFGKTHHNVSRIRERISQQLQAY